MERVRGAAAWLFRDRRSGRIVLGQVPNPAIMVVVGAAVVRATGALPASADEPLRWVGTGALLVWALDELTRGVNPFRRALGAGVLAWQLVRLAGG